MGNASRVEPLERRALLAHVGLDLRFGDAGYAPVDASLLVAPLPGGKVLAVGKLGAVRLNPDGSLDEVFVDRGTKSDVPREAYRAVVAGQQLFIAGVTRTAPPEEFGKVDKLFVRKVNLKTGGTGAGFGVDGIVTFDPVLAVKDTTAINFGPASMIPTADGGVIIAVTELLRLNQSDPQAIVLHKLDAAGKLDPAFGNKGVVIATSTTDYLASAQLAAYGDGRFALLGGIENYPTLQRFNADGSIDTTFGHQGLVDLNDVGLNFFHTALGNMIAQPDGKLVFPVSAADISLEFSFSSLARLNADGTRDTSFGGDGSVELGREGGAFFPSDIAIDSAGRLVGVARDVELYRVMPDGSLDTTFDDDGFSTIPQAPGVGSPVRANLAIDFAGNVLLGRQSHAARFADGQQRVDLDSDGVVHIDGTGGADTVTASLAGDTLTVTINGQSFDLAANKVGGFLVTCGAGDDVIDLSAATFAAMTVNGGDGNDSIVTGDRADRIASAAGDDTVRAGGGKDTIYGGIGGDSIWGDNGDDLAFGEYGNDSISGGNGNDRLYGGDGTFIEPGEYDSGYDGDDSLSGNAGNDRCVGQKGQDRVAGNGGRDRLFGGDGGDRIYGGTSGDWLYAGEGADQLFGEGGLDRLYADDDEGLSWEDTLHGGAGDDTLISRDARIDHLFGDRGRDTSVANEDDILASIESRT